MAAAASSHLHTRAAIDGASERDPLFHLRGAGQDALYRQKFLESGEVFLISNSPNVK
jgi:hypothetical protein